MALPGTRQLCMHQNFGKDDLDKGVVEQKQAPSWTIVTFAQS